MIVHGERTTYVDCFSLSTILPILCDTNLFPYFLFDIFLLLSNSPGVKSGVNISSLCWKDFHYPVDWRNF